MSADARMERFRSRIGRLGRLGEGNGGREIRVLAGAASRRATSVMMASCQSIANRVDTVISEWDGFILDERELVPTAAETWAGMKVVADAVLARSGQTLAVRRRTVSRLAGRSRRR